MPGPIYLCPPPLSLLKTRKPAHFYRVACADDFVTTTEKLTVCICIYSQVHLETLESETVSYHAPPPFLTHLINSTYFVLFPALETAPPVGLHQPWPHPTTLRANNQYVTSWWY